MKNQNLQLEINDAEKNCIDVRDHQARIEVHFTGAGGTQEREESKEIARTIFKCVNMHDSLIRALKLCEQRFTQAAFDENGAIYDEYAKEIEILLKQAE